MKGWFILVLLTSSFNGLGIVEGGLMSYERCEQYGKAITRQVPYITRYYCVNITDKEQGE